MARARARQRRPAQSHDAARARLQQGPSAGLLGLCLGAAVVLLAAALALPVPAGAAVATMVDVQPVPGPNGWSLPVMVSMTATSDGAGAVTTQYRPLGASEWTTYIGPFGVTAQGISTFEYRSTDSAPSEEPIRTFAVRIDNSLPVSFAPLGVPKGWSRGPVKVRLLAGDALSGVARIEYRVAGASAWNVYTGSLVVSAQGLTTIEYRAVDNVGLEERPQTRTISIDGRRPVTKAFACVVKRGRQTKLTFRVEDPQPGSDRAVATLEIYRGGRRVKAFSPVACAVNVRASLPWRCKLAPGAYALKVLAVDLAGNTQSHAGMAKLIVKR